MMNLLCLRTIDNVRGSIIDVGSIYRAIPHGTSIGILKVTVNDGSTRYWEIVSYDEPPIFVPLPDNYTDMDIFIILLRHGVAM